MQKERRTAHSHQVRPVVKSLLGQKLSEKTSELPSKRLHAGKGTNEGQSSRLNLLEEFESHACSDGASNNDDVLLTEAQLLDGILIDVVGILTNDPRTGLSGVNTIARVFHGKDIGLG